MTATDADGRDAECRVRLPASTLREYRRFSLYNSPYPAHDAGCAIDLYPATNDGRSPVAGEVIETRTVRAPSKSYADDEEYLILVDVDLDASGIDVESPAQGLVARVLHVQPSVAPGDRVGVGDSLAGRLLVYDAAGATIETVPVKQSPDCPVCGSTPGISDLTAVTYDGDCAISD